MTLQTSKPATDNLTTSPRLLPALKGWFTFQSGKITENYEQPPLQTLKKRRPITTHFQIWEVHFGPWEISHETREIIRQDAIGAYTWPLLYPAYERLFWVRHVWLPQCWVPCLACPQPNQTWRLIAQLVFFSSSFPLVGPATHHPKVDAVDCPPAIVKNHVSVQYVVAVYNRDFIHIHYNIWQSPTAGVWPRRQFQLTWAVKSNTFKLFTVKAWYTGEEGLPWLIELIWNVTLNSWRSGPFGW